MTGQAHDTDRAAVKGTSAPTMLKVNIQPLRHSGRRTVLAGHDDTIASVSRPSSANPWWT